MFGDRVFLHVFTPWKWSEKWPVYTKARNKNKLCLQFVCSWQMLAAFPCLKASANLSGLHLTEWHTSVSIVVFSRSLRSCSTWCKLQAFLMMLIVPIRVHVNFGPTCPKLKCCHVIFLSAVLGPLRWWLTIRSSMATVARAKPPRIQTFWTQSPLSRDSRRRPNGLKGWHLAEIQRIASWASKTSKMFWDFWGTSWSSDRGRRIQWV